MSDIGMVYLVGAGPGDPGLLTVRGAELIRAADVLVYDALVSIDLLQLAPPSVEIIYAGKRPHDRAISQDELNTLLASKAREGKSVVRLKGGDPYVFGRGGEEAEELVKEGIPFEMVPGITSVLAGPAYAGIPITHREHCSAFTVLTGHEDPSKGVVSIDYEQVARMPGTKVVLMGVERLPQIAKELISHGMNPKTPIGMVRWGTTGRQQTLTGTLDDIAERVRASGFKAPAVTVIGDVVSLRGQLNWFEKRPLFHRRIVVTRSCRQASELSQPLRGLGAEVLEIPTIRTVAPDDKSALVDALIGLNSYSWLVFTSPNGVTSFFDYFFKSFSDIRDIGGVKIAAVGPATAAKVKEFHLMVDAVPDRALTQDLPDVMGKVEDLENLNVLLARAQVANPELPEALSAAGAIVDDVAFYKTVPETEDRFGAATRFEEEGADWITFTSSSTVDHFHARFDLTEIVERHPELRLASIGPETTKALVEIGLKPHVEARPHTIEGLIAALLDSE